MSILSTLLFPAPRSSYSMHSFPEELVWIPWDLDYSKCKSGDCFPSVLLQCPNARYLILYLHSNGEDVGLCHPFGCGLRMVLEVHVLLVEYPGYGICPGHSSEESLWQTAQSAFRFVTEILNWPAEDVIIMGRSLGAATATRLASKYPCHGLILVAPFLSLADAVGQYIGGLAKVVVGDMFSTRDHIQLASVRLLLVHGKLDKLIPCSQGQQLYDLCPSDQKLLVMPEEMNHNCDLLSNPEFMIRPMLRFFALPDYNFDDLIVPAEVFDKRHCLQYHSLVEMTRGDAPLSQPLGDQDTCPRSNTDEGLSGPVGLVRNFPAAVGDLDDLEGSNDYTVRSTPRWSSRRPLPDGIGAVPFVTALGQTPESRIIYAAGIAVLGDRSGDTSGDSRSTTIDSSSPTRPSSEHMPTSVSGAEDVTDNLANLPGLRILDIDNGISRFLHEGTFPEAL